MKQKPVNRTEKRRKFFLIVFILLLNSMAIFPGTAGLYTKKIAPSDTVLKTSSYQGVLKRAGGGGSGGEDGTFVKEEKGTLNHDYILFFVLSGISYGLYIGCRSRKRSKF
jgi:hypothetical protein